MVRWVSSRSARQTDDSGMEWVSAYASISDETSGSWYSFHQFEKTDVLRTLRTTAES